MVGGDETTQDYAFLISFDEIGVYSYGCGTLLNYRFTDDESRKKINLISPNSSFYNYYWTRCYPDRSVPYGTITIMSNGVKAGSSVYHTSGIAPIIVLY